MKALLPRLRTSSSLPPSSRMMAAAIRIVLAVAVLEGLEVTKTVSRRHFWWQRGEL
jgi:hypothetical protein